MATKRTYIDPTAGAVVTFRENRTYMSPFGSVIQERLIAAPGGISIPVVMNQLRNQGIS